MAATAAKILANMEKVVIGKRNQLTLCLVAYFCEGHILLEDVPGVAKTMLGRALARSVGCTFKRLQCTPDLLPTDVTGVSIFNQKTAEFEFRAGPVFAQTLLVDEINRATPRTQSALLEAMAERRVSVDGQTYTLKPPFLVIATQNPIDHEGTFPLPEAQLDRFLIRLSLGYPTHRGGSQDADAPPARPSHRRPRPRSCRRRRCWRARRRCAQIHVDDKIRRYLLEIVQGTRTHDDVSLGGSPRASIALFRTAQAYAAINGRDFVLPDDVKRMVQPVLAHRMILRPESRLRKVTPAALLHEIVSDVRVPVPSERPPETDEYE